MKDSDGLKLQAIYENAIFIARADDLSPETHEPGMASDPEGHNVDERDPSEIHMAKADLKKIAEYAQKLYELVDNTQGLEGWVAAKITKASDYISSAFHWLDYNQQNNSCGCQHDHD